MQHNRYNESTSTPESLPNLRDPEDGSIIVTRTPRFRVVTDPVRLGVSQGERNRELFAHLHFTNYVDDFISNYNRNGVREVCFTTQFRAWLAGCDISEIAETFFADDTLFTQEFLHQEIIRPSNHDFICVFFQLGNQPEPTPGHRNQFAEFTRYRRHQHRRFNVRHPDQHRSSQQDQ